MNSTTRFSTLRTDRGFSQKYVKYSKYTLLIAIVGNRNGKNRDDKNSAFINLLINYLFISLFDRDTATWTRIFFIDSDRSFPVENVEKGAKTRTVERKGRGGTRIPCAPGRINLQNRSMPVRRPRQLFIFQIAAIRLAPETPR